MATFDIEQARKDGVTDSQIIQWLAPKVNFDAESALKDNVPEARIADFLSKRFEAMNREVPKEDVASTEQDKAIRENPNLYGAYGATKALANQAIKPALQAVGGVVGSAGGPIIGSALGYGAGTKVGEIVERGVAKAGEYLGFEKAPEAKGALEELKSSAVDIGTAMAFGKAFDLAGQGAAFADTFLFDKLPQKLMSSAVKMPLTKRWTKVLPGEEITRREAATTEALKSSVTPGQYGREKIVSLEKEVRGYIDDFLDLASTNPKNVLNRDELLANGLKKAYADAERSSDPVGAKVIIDDIAAKFRAHPEEIPFNQANKIKQQLYRETSWTGNEKTAIEGQLNETAKKGISHEIMVKLENAYPALEKLNATDSARISLRDAIEKEVALQSQKNVFGLSAKVLMRPWSWPLALWDSTVGHPAIKSRLAIALSKANPEKYGTFEYPAMPEAYQGAKPSEPQPTGWTPPPFKVEKSRKPMSVEELLK